MSEHLKKWIKAALIRAVRTVAQTAIATIGTTSVVLSDVHWTVVLSASLLAGLLSLLTSVAGLPEVGHEPEQKPYPDYIEDEGEDDGECL